MLECEKVCKIHILKNPISMWSHELATHKISIGCNKHQSLQLRQVLLYVRALLPQIKGTYEDTQVMHTMSSYVMSFVYQCNLLAASSALIAHCYMYIKILKLH